jgi:hypothetical protein
MAQVDPAYANCGAPACAADASKDVIYTGKGGANDTSISLTYNPGLTTALPLSSPSCANVWTSACRITIDYAASDPKAAYAAPAHIDPLWSVNRGANTCTTCHTPTRTKMVACTPVGTNTAIMVTLGVPADGGLSLDADPAQLATAQLRAYQQLVSTHTSSSFSLDPAGTCAVIRTDTQVSGPIASGSAAGSRFFAVLSGSPASPVNHNGFMTAGELRLLSEWVDIGAQYYNNPFAAPLN